MEMQLFEQDIFGNKKEVVVLPNSGKKVKTSFLDYEGFVEKFETKKTTDDCYTPQEVYDLVLDYVSNKFNMEGREIVRPFFPGGDYENFDYPPNCAVVDNPPFSIITKIVRFYSERGIDFFLFAPHLTLFQSARHCTAIVCGASIIYENGAEVKTSFLSNMLGEIQVLGDSELYRSLEQINKDKRVNLPKYEYPQHILTVSMVQSFVSRGISVRFDKSDLHFQGRLDDQKRYGKSIFGSGFLLSEKAAAEKAAAEKAAAEKRNVVVWELSQRELEIIKSLGQP